MATKEEIRELLDFRLKQAEEMYGLPCKYHIIEMLALMKELYNQESTRYILITEWNMYHTYPTVSGLRNLVDKADKNGFNEYNVVHRRNGRVFINEQNYLKWFKEYKGGDNG